MNRDTVKYIAILAMTLNHIAYVFLEPGTLLCETFTSIGYFTGIVMIYFLVEGYHYTHSVKDYFTRLLVFAVISEVPFCLMISRGESLRVVGFDMLFTLCLCMGVIFCYENVENRIVQLIIFAVIVELSRYCDWGILAPIVCLLFEWSRNDRKKTAIAGAITFVSFGIYDYILEYIRNGVYGSPAHELFRLIGAGLAVLCILFIYNGRQSEKAKTFNKWFFYLYYPVHLLIIDLIKIYA